MQKWFIDIKRAGVLPIFVFICSNHFSRKCFKRDFQLSYFSVFKTHYSAKFFLFVFSLVVINIIYFHVLLLKYKKLVLFSMIFFCSMKIV